MKPAHEYNVEEKKIPRGILLIGVLLLSVFISIFYSTFIFQKLFLFGEVRTGIESISMGSNQLLLLIVALLGLYKRQRWAPFVLLCVFFIYALNAITNCIALQYHGTELMDKFMDSSILDRIHASFTQAQLKNVPEGFEHTIIGTTKQFMRYGTIGGAVLHIIYTIISSIYLLRSTHYFKQS